MNLWKLLLNFAGWNVDISAQRRDKCVICVAPHTSNWDFILGLFAYKSLGREANFLMKEFWFFFPLKYLIKALGGIPVPKRKTGVSLTGTVIEMFRSRPYVNLAVTPDDIGIWSSEVIGVSLVCQYLYAILRVGIDDKR